MKNKLFAMLALALFAGTHQAAVQRQKPDIFNKAQDS